MQIEGEGQRVTVYIGSSDTWHGATASRGVMGFGKNSRIHRAHILGLSKDLPEKFEIIDRPERIVELLPVLDEMVSGGLVVVENVHVIRYQHHPEGPK